MIQKRWGVSPDTSRFDTLPHPRMKYVRTFLAILSFLSVLSAGTYYPSQPGENVALNQYLVKLLPGMPSSVIQSLYPGAVIQDRKSVV